MAYDLGSTLTAKAWAIDSQLLAEQAGHGELFAWAANTMASVVRHDGAFTDAAKIALNGLTVFPPSIPWPQYSEPGRHSPMPVRGTAQLQRS